MNRTIVVLAALVLFLAPLSARAQREAQAVPPNKPGTPIVQFMSDWRAQNPPLYSIAIDSDGRATYHCDPAADPNGGSAPEPYFVEWTASDAIRQKVFDDARKLNFFQNAHFESKAKVAQTGLKTLTYKDGPREYSASYNYSDNPAVRELTELFQSIETTAEMGRKLAHDLRFDRLGVEADLKALQQQQHGGQAIEFGSVLPILQQIANNPDIMRISQQRAAQILRAAGYSTAPGNTTK